MQPGGESENMDELTIDEPMNRISRVASMTLTYLHLDADKVLSAFGRFGRYQMLAYLLTNSVMVCHAASVMVMSFIAKKPNFSCVPKSALLNSSFVSADQCTILSAANETESCLRSNDFRIEYPPQVVHATLGSEFNLVCEDEHWASHATSIFMVGGMIITPILTQLSDRYGRRLTFLIPLWLAVISNIICSLAPDYTTFFLFRLIAGIGTAGFSTIGWVLCLESVSVEFRSLIPFVGTISWVIGYELVGLLRLVISSWRWLYFAISVPGLLTVSYYWLMPESLHWMIVHNKTKEITRYLKHSSRLNKTELALEECRTNGANKETTEIKEMGNAAAKRTLLDIIRSPPLLFHLLLQCFIMCVMNAVYWGLSLFSSDLSEDEMSGYLLSGFVELPAGMLAVFLLTIFGRRTVSTAALLAQSVAMAAAILYPGKNWVSMVLQLLAKVFNSICWAAQPLLIAELSPTSVRNIFYGIVGFVSELGSIGAPYLDILKKIDERAPALVLASLSALAALAAVFAPETKDKPLPEDLDQFDAGPIWNYMFGSRKTLNNTEEEGIEDSQRFLDQTMNLQTK